MGSENTLRKIVSLLLCLLTLVHFTFSKLQKHSAAKRNSQYKSADLNWVFIDSVPNAYGMGNSNINPFCCDLKSGALAVIHQGHPNIDPDGQGHTGTLWYNYSLNDGASWVREPVCLNGKTSHYARYPSATLSNPSGATDPTQIVLEFVASLLTPTNFGSLVVGLDSFTGGTPFASEIIGDYGTTAYIWNAEDATTGVFFVIEKTAPTHSKQTQSLTLNHVEITRLLAPTLR